MLTLLSLRLRIFLFFALLAIGGIALAAGALWVGAVRNDPVLTPLLIFAFANTGLILGIWLLFDENVAKPILDMAAQLRLHAHTSADASLDPSASRYLGDLGPAARALSHAATGAEAQIAAETQRLQDEAARLTEILSAVPMATILLNPSGEIVLYDAQAAELLSRIAPPRLKAPLGDYFDTTALDAALVDVSNSAQDVALRLTCHRGKHVVIARLTALSAGGYMMLVDPPEGQAQHKTERPLIYDFDLLNAPAEGEGDDALLSKLCFVPFDTETTGLSVETDDIIQIGAVRMIGPRILEGETIDTFVDPGRPIPAASTRIHRITDADVREAPDMTNAGRALFDFAKDAVLVAHNAPFDIGFLRRDQDAMGVVWSHPVLDTVLLSAVVFGTTADHSLDGLCARLGVCVPEAARHTAFGDALATAQALARLLPMLEGQGITTLNALLVETRKHGRLLQDLNR